MIKNYRKKAGFTLLEIMIYLALFSIIIGGSMVTVYGIIENSNKTQAQAILQEEANFIFRKLDWAITGSNAILSPAVGSTGTTLHITKSTGTIRFQFLGNKLQIKIGTGTFIDLNNDNVNVTNFTFQHVAGGSGLPKSIISTFTLTDNYGHSQLFTHTKYLRR